MGFFGSVLGGALGKIGSKLLPIPGADGEKIGSYLGNFAPFKKGGRVRKSGAKVRKAKSKSKRKK